MSVPPVEFVNSTKPRRYSFQIFNTTPSPLYFPTPTMDLSRILPGIPLSNTIAKSRIRVEPWPSSSATLSLSFSPLKLSFASHPAFPFCLQQRRIFRVSSREMLLLFISSVPFPLIRSRKFPSQPDMVDEEDCCCCCC